MNAIIISFAFIKNNRLSKVFRKKLDMLKVLARQRCGSMLYFNLYFCPHSLSLAKVGLKSRIELRRVFVALHTVYKGCRKKKRRLADRRYTD